MRIKSLSPALNLAATSAVFAVVPIADQSVASGLAVILVSCLLAICPSLFERAAPLCRYHLPSAMAACIGLYIVREHLPTGGVPALSPPYTALFFGSLAALLLAWCQWLMTLAHQTTRLALKLTVALFQRNKRGPDHD